MSTTENGPKMTALLQRATVGLSAQALGGDGSHHPSDPSDLVRCIAWCERRGHGVKHMAHVSTAWARLVPDWDRLVALLRHEVETRTDGNAPETYREMRRVIDGGIDCDHCDKTGRVSDCEKCKGTGRRSGGRCRPCYGSGVALYCPSCRGQGYTTPARPIRSATPQGDTPA